MVTTRARSPFVASYNSELVAEGFAVTIGRAVAADRQMLERDVRPVLRLARVHQIEPRGEHWHLRTEGISACLAQAQAKDAIDRDPRRHRNDVAHALAGGAADHGTIADSRHVEKIRGGDQRENFFRLKDDELRLREREDEMFTIPPGEESDICQRRRPSSTLDCDP